jgi:hypothetical protein
MAVTAYLYGKVFVALANKEIDLDDSNVKVMLTTSSYVPDQAHDYKNDVTNEVSGNGYTTGGAVLISPAVTYNASTGAWKFTADPTTWSSATITARYAIVYYNTGLAATSPLICYVDFGEDQVAIGGTFTITWSADGVASMTVALPA